MKNFVVPGRKAHIARINPIVGFFAGFSSYSCIIPLVILDGFLWQFQNIYFRIMEIPLIQRRKYVILDRYKLGKLTFSQKFNCFYCEYANGIVGYAKAVVNQMELYSCAIKHELNPLGQEHQKDFFEREKFE
ncbi:hypothetical protein KBB89_00840 [Candidatus Gracilibacteria bacterium]|nr:hypothetical protein [Candidatus Gracilibacteria bacterium]